VYRLLVDKPERKIQLEKPGLRSANSIKMDLVEIRWSGVDWVGLAQDGALLNAVMNLRVP
jgi:hypothetical protein